MGDWAEEQAATNGTTPADELQKLAERNNFKWEAMAMELMMPYQYVMTMCKKHGCMKARCTEFAFRGKIATMRQHCRDHGIPESTAGQMRYRHKDRSPAWCLEKCIVMREWRS